MSARRSFRLLAMVVLLSSAAVATAQAQSATERVLQASRELAELQELLSAREPEIRAAALSHALNHENASARALGVGAALRRFHALTPVASLPPGARIAQQQDVPSLGINQITWAADGRSLRGNLRGQPAEGQLAGERLALQISQLLVSARLTGQQDARPDSVAGVPCQAILALNPARDALTGTLSCQGVLTTFPVELAFGQ
jgi:hypothetical protein